MSLIKVHIDSNRDGQVSQNEVGQRNWVWGVGQPGAILMPNNDRDLNEMAPVPGANSELSEIRIDPISGQLLGPNQTLHLYATENAAKRFSVYKVDQTGQLDLVLGADNSSQNPPISFSSALSTNGEKLYVEANQLPDAYFEGLITLEVMIVENSNILVDVEQVVFRVAPWIMTPNTQRPLKVFTVRITDGQGSVTNDRFLSELSSACSSLNIPLEIVEGSDYASDPRNQDRWIQDEIEFGYCQGSSHTIPVVFDSPRNRALDKFPEAELLGPDFGHFQVDGFDVNSLDSFGNLEVSPPVVVHGKSYPFGRVVFGGKKFGTYGADDRQMMPKIRRLLYAQKVQSPIEVFSDWLKVGHIDEFMNFIPDDSPKGFKLMLASTKSCLDKLIGLQANGHGQVKMFVGREREYEGSGIGAEISIADFLADQQLLKFNEDCQKHIDLNRGILKEELGLDEFDIIEAPVLFKPYGSRAVAYFPDMVNHLVLEDHSLVPKPYGPIINGRDVFEEMMIDCLPGNRQVIFIEDWYSYHEALGEVHCGTNTLRQPFINKKWWETMPDGGFNI